MQPIPDPCPSRHRSIGIAAVLLALVVTAPPVARAAGEERPAQSRRGFAFVQGDRPMRIGLLPAERGYLGVDLLDIGPELRRHYGAPDEAGVLIASVAEGSPAARAGLAVGDVLIAIDGELARDSFHAAREIGRREEGDEVELRLVRDRRVSTLRAELAERERPQLDVGYFFRTCDDEDGGEACEDDKQTGAWDVGVGPGFHRIPIQVRPERFRDALRELDERLDSPEWRARLEALRDPDGLAERLEQLEARIQELEHQLAEATP